MREIVASQVYPVVAHQTTFITIQYYLLDQLHPPVTLTLFVLRNCLLQTPYEIVLSGSGSRGAALIPILYKYMNIKIQSWRRHVGKL